MKLSLHIGTTKTGTTSCQQWFAENREILREQGVIYPTSLGDVNHRSLMIYARDTNKPDKSFARRKIKTSADHKAFREKLRNRFAAEIGQHKAARHWVISNEHLHSKITTLAMIRRVKAFLEPHFESITVYLHLRPQVDLLVSGASQRARLGQIVSLKTLTRPAVSENSAYFNYEQIADRWSRVFGRENLHLVPFRKFPNIAEYLAGEIGIERDKTSVIPHHNEALDWRSMGLVNALGQGGAELGHLGKTLFLDQLPMSEKLQIGQDLARQIQSRFTNSNTRLAALHPEITLDELTPDWARYDAEPNVYKLEDTCEFSEPLVYLINHYRQELRLERGRALLAEAELAIMTQKEAAQEKLSQATTALQFRHCLPELQERRKKLQTRRDGLQGRITAPPA
ncbi:MAG: hypothetical protein KUG74_03370 [Rhodobacteraceae bacterium]|nr:hypothetical protein [Paracoccaceae bacterium]